MIDLIGDIHGHADKLEALLQKLGYSETNGTYAHPTRTVLFVGDYIDRGPQIRKTLQIVKAMTDSGKAIALMGNHEYNALCFHFQEREGGHLRNHDIKNIIQHYETLKQFQNKQDEYEFYLDWFKSLPLFYESKVFRAVHACWDHRSIRLLKSRLKDNRLTDDLIYDSVAKGSALNKAIEITLKGKEIELPAGINFMDKDGTSRKEMRIKWWEDPATATYQSLSLHPFEELTGIQVITADKDYYGPDEIPVFFGHYWLKGNPMLYKNNICCLDYSVAKGGLLVAYRFEEGAVLDENKFVVL